MTASCGRWQARRRSASRCCRTSRPLRKAGAGDFEATAWNGLFVKAGTPPAIIAQLNKAVAEVLADPDLKQKLLGMGIIADPTSPEALTAFFKADIAKWADVIEKNKIEKR